MIALVAVVLAIVGVLAWALTRQVEPAPVPVADTIPGSPPPASPTFAYDTAALPAQTSRAVAPAAAEPPGPSDHGLYPEKAAAPRIAASQLRGMIDRNEVTVIDVRDTMSYQTAHIPGALHIPFALL